MNARLIAISGSSKGTIFAFTGDETLIGREVSASLCLNDPSVSRQHCLISCEPIQPTTRAEQVTPIQGETNEEDQQEPCYTLVDLDSFNGTFINGLPVKQQPLAHGDHITVGDVVLLFLLHDVEPESRMSPPEESELITRSTVRLRAEDALYLHPNRAVTELPVTARVTRDLNTLLRVTTTISSIDDLSRLQRDLLKLILEVIPAEREAILLIGADQVDFESTCGWSRATGEDDSIRVSHRIVTQVLSDGVALLSNDLFQAEGLGERPSLAQARVCSVLCVPLVVLNRPLGVIYLDTSDSAARFEEHHLQLLTAISAIAAAPFENARRLHWLKDENQRLQEEIHVEHQMIGESQAMRSVYQFIGKVAPTDSTVLIRGESGTGKELAARAIHMNSTRATKPFVAINGATLTETLLESELFGHEKGAFTGAIAQKRGKLEIADGGTLFLDEVAELTPVVQAKLLRVLQEREFERVGGSRPIKTDVRFIAATNKNLEDAVAKGTFRNDLYYRLKVLSVTMPSLKDRREDVQLLATHFARAYSRKCKRKIDGISSEARALLRAYDWPGNVRELENTIEHAVVLGSVSMIVPEDLPETLLETPETSYSSGDYHEALKEAKRTIVISAIEETQGNYTEAAKKLGLHPNNLHRLIRNLDLKSRIKK